MQRAYSADLWQHRNPRGFRIHRSSYRLPHLQSRQSTRPLIRLPLDRDYLDALHASSCAGRGASAAGCRLFGTEHCGAVWRGGRWADGASPPVDNCTACAHTNTPIPCLSLARSTQRGMRCIAACAVSQRLAPRCEKLKIVFRLITLIFCTACYCGSVRN